MHQTRYSWKSVDQAPLEIALFVRNSGISALSGYFRIFVTVIIWEFRFIFRGKFPSRNSRKAHISQYLAESALRKCKTGEKTCEKCKNRSVGRQKSAISRVRQSMVWSPFCVRAHCEKRVILVALVCLFGSLSEFARWSRMRLKSQKSV